MPRTWCTFSFQKGGIACFHLLQDAFVIDGIGKPAGPVICAYPLVSPLNVLFNDMGNNPVADFFGLKFQFACALGHD